MNGASHYLEATHPGLALRLNPFNTDARVAAFVELLSQGGISPGEDARQIAATALRFSPGDARGYSMMGEIARRDGDDAAASQWFGLALQHSKTEIRALLNEMLRALRAGDMEEVVRYFDLTLRRWPDQWETVRLVVPALVATEQGAEALRASLAANPPWRSRAVGALLSTQEGVAFMEDLLLGSEAARSEINATVAAMIRFDDPGRAHQFFLSTLSPVDKARFGYVFNPAFLADENPGHFTWRISQASGAETTSGDGLHVRFLDTPTRLGNVSQRLSLPPGRFSLTAMTTAASLEAPKGLYWRLACLNDKKPLTVLDVPEGDYAAALRAEFTVPADGCALQELTLLTGLTVDSWRYRFRGDVSFESVAIAKLD